MRGFKRAVLAVLVSAPAWAQAPDVTALYEVSAAGSVAKLAPGARGTVVLAITAKDGAHVSDEAPLRIELKAKGAALGKEKLTLADSVAKKAEGQKYADPRFEVPVTAPATAGQASVEAKLTFFICTEKVCSRQMKTVEISIEVKGG